MKWLSSPGTRIVVLLGLILSGSCRDGTGPSGPAHPLVGTYDVTTVLDGFTFETGAPSPPDCPTATFYCTHSRRATDGSLMGTLVGTLIVGDTLVHQQTRIEFPGTSGVFAGRFCTAIDLITGCTALGDSLTLDYPRGGLVLESPAPGDTSALGSVSGVGSLSPNIHFYGAKFAGDSIHGRVAWRLTVNRSPPTFYGTFVARRRR